MPRTVADWLIEHFPTAKRQTLRRMVANGLVQVNGTIVRRYNDPLQEKDIVVVRAANYPKASPRLTTSRPHSQLHIIFEDADILIVNKPHGLLTSTVPREKRPTLLAMVREHVATGGDRQARVGLIHRLDRDAAGLLVFSKSDLAYQSLKTQFFHHDVERVYHAVVSGAPRPEQGRIESRLTERIDGSVHSTRQIGKGVIAITRYETLNSAGGRSLLRITLETGRKHQIRVHLSEKGWPIAGDRMYGVTANAAPSAGPLMLTATRIGFAHPRTQGPVRFELPLPVSMQQLLEATA